MVARVEKFHTFCYGKTTIVLSDHKPLTSIVCKDLFNAPPRLQRLLLCLQKYNMTIRYKPGKSMIFADHLSRNINPESSKVPTIPGLNLESWLPAELYTGHRQVHICLTPKSMCHGVTSAKTQR